ncbi:unnamed protein product [Orchesella dallaii]|uniref:Uncharacterized protein n=1 Tax=Orchesella dallaii TaxID=48710 RepID=A0ABP1RAB9_9HEXA
MKTFQAHILTLLFLGVVAIDAKFLSREDYLNSTELARPALAITYLNKSHVKLNDGQDPTNGPCRGTVLKSTCFDKEQCIWLRGGCTRRFPSNPPLFTFPQNLQAGIKRLEIIWKSPPFPSIPPVVWQISLAECLTFVVIMVIVYIFKILKSLICCCCCRCRRKANHQPSNETDGTEAANQYQDTFLIHYPKGTTMISKRDIFKQGEYQVLLVHKSLLNGCLPDGCLTQKLGNILECFERQPDPSFEPSHSTTQVKRSVSTRNNGSENEETTL